MAKQIADATSFASVDAVFTFLAAFPFCEFAIQVILDFEKRGNMVRI